MFLKWNCQIFRTISRTKGTINLKLVQPVARTIHTPTYQRPWVFFINGLWSNLMCFLFDTISKDYCNRKKLPLIRSPSWKTLISCFKGFSRVIDLVSIVFFLLLRRHIGYETLKNLFHNISNLSGWAIWSFVKCIHTENVKTKMLYGKLILNKVYISIFLLLHIFKNKTTVLYVLTWCVISK